MVIDTLTSVREIMSLERSLKNRGRHLIQWRSMMLLIQVSPFLKVDGVVCASCKIKFGDKEELGATMPSVKCPIYVCSGRTSHVCVYSLCNTYHAEKLNEGIGKRKKLRKS